VREWLKLEFNGELIWIKEVKGSKTAAHMIGRSTKGRDVLQPFMEQVLVWLMGTFLRCSLRQQQPWLGSRRFDDLCDPSSCVHVRWGLGQRSQQQGIARESLRRPFIG
jgi:hypothetical protein